LNEVPCLGRRDLLALGLVTGCSVVFLSSVHNATIGQRLDAVLVVFAVVIW
jgi:hypothetical protein